MNASSPAALGELDASASAEHSGPVPKSGVVNPLPVQPLTAAERQARLTELLHGHHASVWRTLRRFGVSEDRADDAAQEVFIIAARKLELVRDGCERKYLLQIAIRVAANHRRAVRARPETPDELALESQCDPAPSADSLLQQKRLRALVDAVLSRWSPELRTAFVLFELEGLSVPEIAELTETKLGTVASRLREGRKLFRAAVTRLQARGELEGGAA